MMPPPPYPALPLAGINKVTTNGLIKGDQSGEYVPVLALDCRCRFKPSHMHADGC